MRKKEGYSEMNTYVKDDTLKKIMEIKKVDGLPIYYIVNKALEFYVNQYKQ
jgi:hypothetical protein